jgi:DNA-binding beta-propeller fold protein YncE
MFPRRLVPILLVALWCVLGAAQNVREIALLDIPGKPGFDGIALMRGMVLMSHSGAGTVDIFDPVKRRLIAHVKGMSDPRGIGIDDDGGQIFIANHGAKDIVILAAGDWHVAGSIPLTGSPAEIAYIPAWGLIAVTDPVGQQLILVDVRSHQQANAFPLAGTPSGITFDNSRGLLCVTLQDVHQVVTLNRQLQVVRRMDLNASQPTGIVYDRKLDRLYVSVRYAVLSLNASEGKELSRVPADGGIDRLWLDDESRMLYGAAGGSLLVMRADGRLHALDELSTDVKGYSVAYDPDHKLLFFPGGREGRSKLLLLKSSGDAANTDPNAEAKLR